MAGWQTKLPFQDRLEAGRVLGGLLERYRDREDAIVLALPRGGVPVGGVVASHLRIPLDVFLVRKLGVPGQEELAFGAIASGGIRVLNRELIDEVMLSATAIENISASEAEELERRELAYRAGLPPLKLRGRTAILVDDGLATGSTMMAAVRAARQLEAGRAVVAIPVAAHQAVHLLEQEADEVVCAATPVPFRAVGVWYEEFGQTTDEEVRRVLEDARVSGHHPAGRP
jgi:putative phosphoribosyl transferase